MVCGRRRRWPRLGRRPHEIGAITGHNSLKEIERYTKAAQRQRHGNAGHVEIEVI